MKKVLQSFKNAIKRDETNESENGFSLVEMVIAVAIMLVLTIGGAISYSDLESGAKVSAYESAVEEVFIAAVVYESDYDPNTTWETAAAEWNYATTGAEACPTNRDCNDFRVWGSETTIGGNVRINLNVYKPNTNGTPSNTIILKKNSSQTAIPSKTLYRTN